MMKNNNKKKPRICPKCKSACYVVDVIYCICGGKFEEQITLKDLDWLKDIMGMDGFNGK